MKQPFFNIGIFLICFMLILTASFFYVIPNLPFCNECSISFSVYTSNFGNHYNYTLNDFLENKKFYKYEFTGNNSLDDNIFKKYRIAMHLLSKLKDTLNGIHFKFNQFTNYQRFIDAFDICFIENASYIYSGNDLWIMNKSVENEKNKYLFNIQYYEHLKNKPAANRR